LGRRERFKPESPKHNCKYPESIYVFLRNWITRTIVLLALNCSGAVFALDAAQYVQLATGDSDARVTALDQVALSGDRAAIPFLQSLLDDAVKVAGERVYVVDAAGAALDPVVGTKTTLPAEAEDVVNNNRMRGELEATIALLNLQAPELAQRVAAVEVLRNTELQESKLPLLERALQDERNASLHEPLLEISAGLQLLSVDKAIRLKAARQLREGNSQNIKQLLSSRLAAGGETDTEVRVAIETSLAAIDRRQAVYGYVGMVFTGISLGSILMLAALGLAVTYGLMGVINMAHGEMMMLGAYATFIVQNLFRQYLPAWFDWYVIAALPVAFVVTALVGMALERSVIRFLYGRPLETLLATWGISLVLMQLVRSLFGAQNVQVENPGWLSGGIDVAANLVLPYNRIAIIVFSVLVLLLMWAMLTKTRLGLFVRAVTQNRAMASCVGVDTRSVDTRAFGLGSGIAGLAGVALSQIGNVGPDLGKSYIVDSFMVVVLGGVGQLAGAVYAALGLGVLSKFLEGFAGAVLAKIIVLVVIIVFIQKRPQGIFALQGRSAD
jgi:urea transport system permease protein